PKGDDEIHLDLLSLRDRIISPRGCFRPVPWSITARAEEPVRADGRPCRTSVDDRGVQECARGVPLGRGRGSYSVGLVSQETAEVVVERRRVSWDKASPLGVAQECRVPGDRRGGRKRLLETGLEVDGDHQPCEERSDRICPCIPPLGVAAAAQLG